MALSTAELSLIEQRVTNEGPTVGTAYLLWLFTGLFSGHRWYLGRGGTAILQMLSYLVLVGFVWWIIDGFLIPGMVREKQGEVRQRLTVELLASHHQSTPAPAPAA